jgi:hypothetical protein
VGIVGVLKGRGQAAGSVTGIRDVEAFVEELGFDGPGPAHAPPSRHHLLNDAKLDAVGGLEAFEVIGHDFSEALGRFVCRTTMRASKAWRRAFCEEISLPDSVTGPRERAPLARPAGEELIV